MNRILKKIKIGTDTNKSFCDVHFTIERETDRKLAFLDTCVHRTIEGKLETDVYRKRLTQTNICHLTRTIREAIKSPWQQPCFSEQKA